MSKIVNLTEAAEIAGKQINTVKSWARDAGDSWVVERGNKSRAWQIDVTAMLEWREDKAIEEAREVSAAPGNSNMALDGLLDRLDGDSWRKIHKNPVDTADLCTVDQLSGLAEHSEIMRWLRMGMPYHTEGDWETGDGFLINFAWLWDWTGLVSSLFAHERGQKSYDGRPYKNFELRVGGA